MQRESDHWRSYTRTVHRLIPSKPSWPVVHRKWLHFWYRPFLCAIITFHHSPSCLTRLLVNVYDLQLTSDNSNLQDNDLNGNENCFELPECSSYRGFELPGVDCVWRSACDGRPKEKPSACHAGHKEKWGGKTARLVRGWGRWFPPFCQLLIFPPIRTLGVEQAPYHFIAIVCALFHFSSAAAKCLYAIWHLCFHWKGKLDRKTSYTVVVGW